MQAKNTMPRKLGKKSKKKHRFGSQHVSKNRPRRPPGAPWPPPARDFRAKSSPKALLEASRGEKNSKGAPGRNFGNNWQTDFFEAGSFPTWSAVLARPVKAYPGGLGQARLGSKIPNTLITASGGRRIDDGSANTADHPLLARRFVSSACLNGLKPCGLAPSCP